MKPFVYAGLWILFVWALGVGVHFLWEAWIIAARGIDTLPECRRWWCRHGLRNRLKKGCL